jgi:hypothetical protein
MAASGLERKTKPKEYVKKIEQRTSGDHQSGLQK